MDIFQVSLTSRIAGFLSQQEIVENSFFYILMILSPWIYDRPSVESKKKVFTSLKSILLGPHCGFFCSTRKVRKHCKSENVYSSKGHSVFCPPKFCSFYHVKTTGAGITDNLGIHFRHAFMVNDVRISECRCLGDIYLYDLSGFRLGHLTKITPSMIKKCEVAATVSHFIYFEVLYKFL